jgi:hypothetical protein
VKLKDELLLMAKKLAHTEECIRDIQEAIISKGVTVTLSTPLEQFGDRIRMIMTPGDVVFAFFRSAFGFSDSLIIYDADARNKSELMFSDSVLATLESIDDWKKADFRETMPFSDNANIYDLDTRNKSLIPLADNVKVTLEDIDDWLKLDINEAIIFTDKASEGHLDTVRKSLVSLEDSLAVFLDTK